MFNITSDFFVGLGIYTAISTLSICILFYILKTYKRIKHAPILHTVILFANYTWLFISLVVGYYGLWISITALSYIYLILIAPLFKLYFVSKYFHLKSKTKYYRNIYGFSLTYLILIPIWITALLVL